MGARPIAALCVTAHPDRPEAETFIGLTERGFDLRVLCEPAAQNYARLEASGVDVRPFTISRRLDLAAIRTLRSQLESMRPDILHLFNNRAVLNGLQAARGQAVKVVVYRGNVGNVSVLDPLSWLRYLNPRIDRIVCVADAVRDSLAAVGFASLRIPRWKLVTIRKGHDLAWYTASALALDGYGVPPDAYVVGCVANWRPRKGIDVLLDACERLPQRCPVHVVLVGNMANVKLERRIAASSLASRIHVLGHRLDVPAVTSSFDVAVLPAIKREGLPKTVIEAMACGVATVATRVGGVAEIIEDGRNGLIVPPGDPQALAQALLRLHDQPDLRAALGRAGRERIGSALRVEDTIARTAALYEDLVGAAGPSSAA
ncbi:MAG TPA: glycosyltransferase [Gammaproteobacteria bacterium]|nr:glycosyltransferase [Gammaproteobacteria bacterium]